MIDVIWRRIKGYEGQVFKQIRGGEFIYSMDENYISLSTTNYSISRKTLNDALKLVPLKNTVPVQHLFAPSYLYAILMDERIRKNDW